MVKYLQSLKVNPNTADYVRYRLVVINDYESAFDAVTLIQIP